LNFLTVCTGDSPMELSQAEMGTAGASLAGWIDAHRKEYPTNTLFAKACNRSVSWLSKVLAGDIACRSHEAVCIHVITGGEVPASQLRPDIWRRKEDVPVERFQKSQRGRRMIRT
jgi:hypothetical protein